jgi:hypothetical protein
VRNPDITPGEIAALTVRGGSATAVELRCYTRPDRTYRTVRSATLAQGVAIFGLRPGSNTRCYARYAGDDTAANPSVVINVHMVISIGAFRTGPLTYVFAGRTLPRTPSQVVNLYRLGASGHLIRTATALTDDDGVWRLTRGFQAAGSHRFVAWVRTANNAAGVSIPPYLIALH